MHLFVILLTLVWVSVPVHEVWAQTDTKVPQAAAAMRAWNLPVTDPMLLPHPAFHGREIALRDRDGNLWVATASHGVGRFDAHGSTLRIYSMADGLVSNKVESLLLDSQGRLWVGTVGRGVSYFAPQAREPITLLTADEGIVYPWVVHEDKQGRLWFGGSSVSVYWLKPGDAVLQQAQVMERSLGSLRDVVDVPWDRGVLVVSGAGSFYFPPEPNTVRDLNEVLPVALLDQLRQRAAASKQGNDDPDKREPRALGASQSPSGTLWIVFAQGLVFCRTGFDDCALDTKWKWPEQGTPYQIRSSDDGALWCASAAGLFFRPPDDTAWKEIRASTGESLKTCLMAPASGNPRWINCRPDSTQYRLERTAPTHIVARPIASHERETLLRESASETLRLHDDRIEQQGSKTGAWQPIGDVWRLLMGNGWYREYDMMAGGGARQYAVRAAPVYHRSSTTYFFSIFGLDNHRGTWSALSTSPGAMLYYSPFGTLWINRWFYDELAAYSGDTSIPWQPLAGKPRGKKEALAVLEDRKRRVWIATPDGLQQCNWTERTCKDSQVGQGIGMITTLYESPQDGRIWLGGAAGTVRVLFDDKRYDLPMHPLLAPPERSKTWLIRSIQEDKDTVWIGLEGAVLAYRRAGLDWLPDPQRSRTVEPADMKSMLLDAQGRLWLLRGVLRDGGDRPPSSVSYLSIYDPAQPVLRTFGDELLNGSATLPDDNGAVWLAKSEGVGRLAWNKAGVPGRQELIAFSERTRWLGRLARQEKDTWVLWRTRFTGLLRATDKTQTPFPTDTGYPVSVVEPTADGGVWVGYHMNGLARWGANGREATYSLPNPTVLDISAVPGAGPPRAWVATNDGAAFVSSKGVVPVPVNAAPGPVDAVVALPDGRAYAAFNPIPADLFLTSDQKLIDTRREPHLRLIESNGSVGEPIKLLRGDVLDMALDKDGKTVWIGSTAGLYVLRTDGIKQVPSEEATIHKVDAKGRLGDLPVRLVAVAPDGTIWMGVDRQSSAVPASIVGYNPKRQDIDILNVDRGLPAADRIEMLDFLPDGRLATLAAGRLLRSIEPLSVPSRFPWAVAGMVAGATLALVGLALVGVNRQQKRRREMARYAELMAAAESFFAQIECPTQRRDYRTLTLTSTAATAMHLSTEPVTIYCLPEGTIDAEQVKAVADSLPSPSPGTHVLAYIFAAREPEPAARWRLDTYRLRQSKVIIPLTLSYTRRALDQGIKKAQDALEELNRRYLAEQDLFDMRNALDEPRFFYGQRALIGEILLGLGRREHMAIIGQRKSGKTSVVNVLAQQLEDFPIMVIDLELYTRTEPWPPQFFQQILKRYDDWGHARFGNSWQPTHGLGAEVSGTDFEAAIKDRHHLRGTLGHREPLVVVLDEIERIFPRPQAAGGTAEEAWRYLEATGILRALGQHQGERLLCLMVVDRTRTFNRINHFDIPGMDTNPLYALFVEKFVLPLTVAECIEMLQDIGHAMGIEVSEEMARAIHGDSGGQPRFARLLASAAYQQRDSSERLGMEQYKRGLAWLRDDDGGADVFIRENIWWHVSDAERTVLARSSAEAGVERAVVEAPGPALGITLEQTTNAPILELSALREARQHLTVTGLLEEIEARVRVNGALVRLWLRENVRLAEGDARGEATSAPTPGLRQA